MIADDLGYCVAARDLKLLLRYYALSHRLVNKVPWADLVAVALKELIPGDLLAEEVKSREVLNMR